MKLTINIWERAMLVNVVGATGGTTAVIRIAGKALDILEFSPAEQKEINFRVLPGGNQAWDTSDATYNLEIKDKEAVALVRRAYTQFEHWKALDRHKIQKLEDKLNVKKSEP